MFGMPMDPVRVHLGQMPPMLRAMINDLLSSESDFEIVGNSFDRESIETSTDGADVLITAEQQNRLPRTVLVLKRETQTCRIITLYERECALGPQGFADLAQILREARRSAS